MSVKNLDGARWIDRRLTQKEDKISENLRQSLVNLQDTQAFRQMGEAQNRYDFPLRIDV